MPDITMCKGGNCPFQYKCWRFVCSPNDYQSYFAEIPYEIDKNICEYFWDIEPILYKDLKDSSFRD